MSSGEPQAEAQTETEAQDDANDPRRFSTLYFGYGSNLSPLTLQQRCPDSVFGGIARLDDYRIFINETRYGNVIPSPGDYVYGTLAFLSPRDEKALDISEGVPYIYQKHRLRVKRIRPDAEEQEVVALCYVDVNNVGSAEIEPDYIPWMRKAIVHGMDAGVPKEYVDKYLRPMIPENAPTTISDIMYVRMKFGRDDDRFPDNAAGPLAYHMDAV